jgi:hypothetical protein
MKTLTTISLALAVAAAGAQTTSQSQIRHIETSLNHLTVLEFDESVTFARSLYSCASVRLISGWALRAGTARRHSLPCLGFSFLFRGVQRGYFSFMWG